MAAVASVALDHMRRVNEQSHSRSGAVTVALVDSVAALGVLWTLFQYEGIPLPTIAPSVRCFLYFCNLQFCQLVGTCSSGDLGYLASQPETLKRTENYRMEITFMRREMQQIYEHMVTWLRYRSLQTVAEVERLVQAALHALDDIRAIIQDPVFGELHDSLAEIPNKIKEWQHVRQTCTVDAMIPGGTTESSSSSSSPTALATAEPSHSSGTRVVQARFADPAGDQTLLDEEESV